MLQYPQKIPIDITLHYMAWCNAKNLNQILHFWNLWVKGFQTVYGVSKSVDILKEALIIDFCGKKIHKRRWYMAIEFTIDFLGTLISGRASI